ncbi:arginase family protein [Candidatus Micrarchaeota archaeon]|nr:arginase family protein [Candidatus Micrarchaeota archaeon]
MSTIRKKSKRPTMKFAYANAKKFEEADYILFGVPDETGSHSELKGVSLAPNTIRKISNERFGIKRGNKISLFQPQQGVLPKIYDYGNVKKKEVEGLAEKIVEARKKPILLGGDHSITYEVLKGISKVKEVSFVYFDAHPDFISSERHYYGSVICDISELKNVKVKQSIEIGIRVPEAEELYNLRKYHVKTITSLELTQIGIHKALERIRSMIKNYIYVSIDMDVLDPAFAPGVNTPIPGGMSSSELIFLAKNTFRLRGVGLDIMEVNPKRDVNDITSQLATSLIIETIAL